MAQAQPCVLVVEDEGAQREVLKYNLESEGFSVVMAENGDEAMLLVADRSSIFTVTGVGDVLEPEHGVAAVGSGGNFALSAARALIEETELDAEQIARKAMKIAAEVCVYTNGNLTVETLEG